MTSPFPALETAPEITGPLAFGAPVAVAVPGGKGSDVAAAETLAYLLKVHDLVQSATCPDNHDIYRGVVELEIVSTFSFQEGHWLGDIAPGPLSEKMPVRLRGAKRRATRREAAEARIGFVMIPQKHLCFIVGFERKGGL